jgi:flagellum-specific peptidoglycan hydrolase FlgJ
VCVPLTASWRGEVGTARGQFRGGKTSRPGKQGGARGKVDSIDDDDSEQEQKKKQKKKVKQVPHNHSSTTFLDDGKQLSKSTRASHESSMITSLVKLTPQEATPLDALFKHRAQLLEEDQTLMTNLILAQNVLEKTDTGDTDGVLWAKEKFAKLCATSNKADVARERRQRQS